MVQEHLLLISETPDYSSTGPVMGSDFHTHYPDRWLVFSHDWNIWVASPMLLPVVVEVAMVQGCSLVKVAYPIVHVPIFHDHLPTDGIFS
jgi:hypothetical protein